MIIWKGFGILAAIIPFGLAILFQLIFGDNPIYMGIGYTIGAILIWFLGLKLNTNTERLITNPKTSQQFIQKVEHSLFWIKMELWSPIFILLGIAFMLSNLTNGKSVDYVFPLCGIVLIGIVLYMLYQKQNASPSTADQKKNPTLNTKVQSIESKPTETKRIDKSSPTKNSKPISKMSEDERMKKQFYAELRSNRNKPIKLEPTDHSKYMPKN